MAFSASIQERLSKSSVTILLITNEHPILQSRTLFKIFDYCTFNILHKLQSRNLNCQFFHTLRKNGLAVLQALRKKQIIFTFLQSNIIFFGYSWFRGEAGFFVFQCLSYSPISSPCVELQHCGANFLTRRGNHYPLT